MYVYCPTWVRGDSAPYNVEKHLSKLITRLETGDRILLSQLFDIRYPYWKHNLRKDIRLLGQLRYLGEVPVLVLFALWLRGSHEYHYFLKQRQNPDYQKWVKGLVPDDVLQVWLAQRQQEHSQNLLPALPEALFAWTQFLNASHPKERLVLESGEWVRQGQALTVVQRRQAYQAVIQLVDDEEGRLYQQLPSFYQGAELRCWQAGSLHLAVSLVQVREYQGKRFPFLIGIYDHAPEQKERFALGRQTRLFGIGADQPDILRHPQPLEVWKQYSYRAYPDYMVADETIWLEMQETKEGNLALSMEEEAVLQSRSMPLLINGRAGSGKSLMLYYCFAEYCSHYLKTARQESPQYYPLFLTYSPALVQQAWEKVSVILRVSHRYRQDERSFSPAEIQQCRAFFSTFQDYLFRCLPTERQEHYQPDKYVNFYQFQRWYRGRRDVELAWHTIRTLIKGYEVSDYLDPDSYRELPEADRSVDIAVFDQIYSELWPGYLERTTHEGYWDDQDLVRDVLKNGTINPIHPVIFCDEVQDFTQIELNVIFCLSPWGKYKLDWTIERLPYAFAGDPLQTINPTGFRWAALKKYLHEHIHAYLLPSHRFEIHSPQELRNNYRSSPQITRFSNVVNLWRRILSNNREIGPQLPWRPQEQGRSVQKFILDGQGKNLTYGELKNMLNKSTGTVCILPCCVGEELSYVTEDPELQKIFAEELAQNLKPAQLQTVTAVKGMEFKKIILYKFGDYYQHSFKKQLKHYVKGTENEVSLQLQYFLNQLYVGITRPIEALAIMDTSCGWQEFWEPNLATDFWLNHPSLKQDQSQWQTDSPVLNSTMQSTGIQYWTDTNLQEVLNLALGFFRRGVVEGNPEFLADARTFAQQAEDWRLEQECQAWLLKLRRDYISAGHQFLKLEQSALPDKNLKRVAWECFWRAKAWSELQQHHATFAVCPDIPDYSPLVALMLDIRNKATNQSRFDKLKEVRDWLRVEVSPQNADATWKTCVQEFLTEFQRVLNDLEAYCPKEKERKRFLQETYEAWVGHLAFLGQRQPFVEQFHMSLGTCHFHQGKFADAVKAWEYIGRTEHSYYYRSKIHLEPLPGKVKWLAKDRQDAEVVRLWQEAGQPLTAAWEEYSNVVLTSLERLRQWSLLMRVLIQRRNWGRLWTTVQRHPRAWQRGHDYELVAALARDTETDWEELKRELPGLRGFLQAVLASVQVEQVWWLPLLEVGLAYERIGDYRNTLRFYEHFTEDKTGAITKQECEQMRQRWQLTRKKYQDFPKTQGNLTQLQQENEELPVVEPELAQWKPWALDFVEHPSPVQNWVLEQVQTATQIQLREKIRQALERLNEAQLQRIDRLIQDFHS